MKRFTIFMTFIGMAIAVVWACIALVLLNTFTIASYQQDTFGMIAAWLMLFIVANGSNLVVTRDADQLDLSGPVPQRKHWDDHYGRALTVFLLKRKILLWIAISIPLVYMLIRLVLGVLYHFVEEVVTPIKDAFANAIDWIQDKFLDFQLFTGWY